MHLRKYARASGEVKKKSATEETIGNVLSGLITLSAGRGEGNEGNTQSLTTTASVSGDPGAFVDEGAGSWIDLATYSVSFPQDLEVNVISSQSLDIEFEEKKREQEESTLNPYLHTEGDGDNQKEDTQTEEKEEIKEEIKEELITIFWPSGLIHPEGEISIDDTDSGRTLKVSWLSTAQITLTGGQEQ